MGTKSIIMGVSLMVSISALAQTAPVNHYGENLLNQQSSLATNVAPMASWSPGWVLVDAFAKATDWSAVDCTFSGQDPGSLALDDSRWIESLGQDQCAYTNVFSNMAGHYPAGEYTLLFEGNGTFVVGPEDYEVFHSPNIQVDEVNGVKQIKFTVDQTTQTNGGISFFQIGTETGYLRNIRLITPGGVCGRSVNELNRFAFCASSSGGTGTCPVDEQCYDFTQVYFDRFADPVEDMHDKVVFHPEYIKHYQKYSAIRYMKWSRPEDSRVSNWDDRVTMDEAMFTLDERGFPYEYMIAMSNQLNADAYFNVPVLANDNYIDQYGTLVNDSLNHHLSAWVEYGNEFFNEL